MSDEHTTTEATAAASPELIELYAEAFRLYGTMALWNVRQFDQPTVAT